MNSFKQNQPSTASRSDIIISGCVIKTIAGNELYFNHAALSTNMSFSKPSEIYEQQDKKLQYKSVLINEISGIEGYKNIERIFYFLSETLLELVINYEKQLSDKNVFVCVLIPPSTSERGMAINSDEWIYNLESTHEVLGNTLIELVPIDQINAVQKLDDLCECINEGIYDYVIFGGTDSLVDSLTFTDLALQRKLQTIEAPDGLVLSEGAGFMLLQSQDAFDKSKISDEDTQKVKWGIIKSLSYQEFEKENKSNAKKTESTKQLIDSVLGDAKIELNDIDRVYTSLGASVKSQLEWHQLSQLLWAPHISEQQRSAIMMRELSEDAIKQLHRNNETNIMETHLTTGEVGAATFPIQMILALASFEDDQTFKPFGFKQSNNILVLDTTHNESRGVLVLSAPQDTLQRKQFGNEPTDDMEEQQWAM